MRLFVDEHGLPWEEAWDLTVRTFGYTNHTLMPEALETWPLPLFGELLPRHLELVYEINRRFLDEVRARFPGDDARVARMSLIGEGGAKSVRMAYLATVGSHAINGVAALHTHLLEDSVLRDFHQMWPERFSNKTNGVTPPPVSRARQPRAECAHHARHRQRVGDAAGGTATAGAAGRRPRRSGPSGAR